MHYIAPDMATLQDTLSNNLKLLRSSRGLSQSELAEKSGVNVETIKRLEGKRSFISLPVAASISKALEVEESELFRVRGEAPPKLPKPPVEEIAPWTAIRAIHKHLARFSKLEKNVPKDILELLEDVPQNDFDILRASIGGIMKSRRRAKAKA